MILGNKSFLQLIQPDTNYIREANTRVNMSSKDPDIWQENFDCSCHCLSLAADRIFNSLSSHFTMTECETNDHIFRGSL